jgi:hypothetical protein
LHSFELQCRDAVVAASRPSVDLRPLRRRSKNPLSTSTPHGSVSPHSSSDTRRGHWHVSRLVYDWVCYCTRRWCRRGMLPSFEGDLCHGCFPTRPQENPIGNIRGHGHGHGHGHGRARVTRNIIQEVRRRLCLGRWVPSPPPGFVLPWTPHLFPHLT